MKTWHIGEPPKRAGFFEVKQRARAASGSLYTVQWWERTCWVGDKLCRRSQMHGGLVPLVLINRWRPAPEDPAVTERRWQEDQEMLIAAGLVSEPEADELEAANGQA